MRNKLLLGLILLLVLVLILFGISFKNYKIDDTDKISVTKWDSSYEAFLEAGESNPLENPERFNEIIVNGEVFISQVFAKPTSCSSMNYSVIKEENIINIIQKRKSSTSQACAQAIAYDKVEITLTLEKGIYIINFYHSWDLDNPSFNKTIQIAAR